MTYEVDVSRLSSISEVDAMSLLEKDFVARSHCTTVCLARSTLVEV